ncbi:MAG: metal-sensitive transcriptional regulator [Chloroflexaceae bacterium]|jgi:DNA-binding FrmR family transcriptional regulator|nr:metal-sensitive transcriptional regulator [Chloroflexaceae bacterium]
MAEPVRTLSPTTRDDVLQRLRRIEGQVRGVQRMVEEGRDCRDIVNQVAAMRAALTSVTGVVLECYAHNCLDCGDQPRDVAVSELIDVVLKATK